MIIAIGNQIRNGGYPVHSDRYSKDDRDKWVWDIQGGHFTLVQDRNFLERYSKPLSNLKHKKYYELYEKLRRILDLFWRTFNIFRFEDEDMALVAGFAGTEEFIGMYEAVEILKKDRERMQKKHEK